MTISVKARCVAITTIWLCLLFVVSRAIIFLFLVGRNSDLGVQQEYVRRIVAGQVPFRDFFPEYPPLVFLFTCIPALIDRSLNWYFPLFRTICCIVDCAVWIVVLQYNRRRVSQCVLYVLCTTALGSLIYDRIDIVLGALLLVAVISMFRGRDDLSQLAIGIGIAFKLIPVILVPMILARAWQKADRSMIRVGALLSLPTILSYAAVAMLGGHQLDKLFEFHAMRGIQIESVPATIEMVLMECGVSGKVALAFGSHGLSTPYENLIITASTALLGVMVLASAWMVIHRRMQSESVGILLCAVLSSALVFSKVLSPQFFLFLLPALVATPDPSRTTTAIANWILIAAVFGLTGALFPWMYWDLVALKSTAQLTLLLRNECLVVLSVSLFLRAWMTSGADQGEGFKV